MFPKAIVTLIAVTWSVVVQADTLTVDLNGGAHYTSIQAAIDAAADGDTVLVKPGEYVVKEPINFNRLHKVPAKNLVVESEGGPEVTTIRMSQTPTNPNRASVVVFESQESAVSVLRGFTITGGTGTYVSGWGNGGGGVYFMNGSFPTVTDCTIRGNSADWGGGVHSLESSPTLTSCTISGNSGHTVGGGGSFQYSSPILTDCRISGNSAGWGGGLYPLNSHLTLARSTIAGNSAHAANGGMESGGAP